MQSLYETEQVMATANLHLLKLCVGTDGPEELAAWHAKRRRETGRDHAVRVTRMWPRRAEELLQGGSLYWVMRGVIRARQTIIGFHERRGEDGIMRCEIRLENQIVLTETAPRRAFQGWRYLKGEDAPRDLPQGATLQDALPQALSLALGEIGVR